MSHSSRNPHQTPGAMTIGEFLRWANIGRSKFYDEVRNKRLFPKKVGTRVVVPAYEAERWLRDLPNAGPSVNPFDSEGK